MKCDLCGSDMAHWFSVPGDWRKPSVDRSFEIVRCPEDTFARVDPTPSHDVLTDHYNIDDYYTHGRGASGSARPTPFTFRIIGRLSKYGDKGVSSTVDQVTERLSPNARVLDIGAGGGGMLLRLHDMGYDVVGIEPDPTAASLKEDFPVPVYQGTGEAIPDKVANQRFDLVVCSHVLEHTTNPMAVMRNVLALLNPGGMFWVEVPNTACLDFRISKLNWQHLGVPRHLVFWNDKTLTAASNKVGFDEHRILYRHYSRQLSWGWANFGFRMIPFYRDRGAYRISVKQFTRVYYVVLFALTVFLPRRLKYDSVVLLATRKA